MKGGILIPQVGLEPTRPLGQQILSLSWLPVTTLRQTKPCEGFVVVFRVSKVVCRPFLYTQSVLVFLEKFKSFFTSVYEKTDKHD